MIETVASLKELGNDYLHNITRIPSLPGWIGNKKKNALVKEEDYTQGPIRRTIGMEVQKIGTRIDAFDNELCRKELQANQGCSKATAVWVDRAMFPGMLIPQIGCEAGNRTRNAVSHECARYDEDYQKISILELLECPA